MADSPTTFKDLTDCRYAATIEFVDRFPLARRARVLRLTDKAQGKFMVPGAIVMEIWKNKHQVHAICYYKAANGDYYYKILP